MINIIDLIFHGEIDISTDACDTSNILLEYPYISNMFVLRCNCIQCRGSGSGVIFAPISMSCYENNYISYCNGVSRSGYKLSAPYSVSNNEFRSGRLQSITVSNVDR